MQRFLYYFLFILGASILFQNLEAGEFVTEQKIEHISQIPAKIRGAIEQVWRLNDDNQLLITAYESTDSPLLTGEPRMEMGHLESDPSKRILRVQFGDRYSPLKASELWIHLDERKDSQTGDFLSGVQSENSLSILLNGVQFRPKGGALPHREVYVGGELSEEDLRDRLRLAVNDNSILNPWHRSKNPSLQKDWGEKKGVRLTEPQEAALRFLEDLAHKDKLKNGAIVQEPTGMGKTETLIQFVKNRFAQKKPVRVLWLVASSILPEQTQARFSAQFPEAGAARVWTGDTLKNTQWVSSVIQGDTEHLFVSMASIQTDLSRQRLRSWIEKESGAPVLVVMDEAHGIGAKTRNDLYDWLWKEFSSRIMGRVGLTATPIHFEKGFIGKYFGHNTHYALLNPQEIDSETGLPKISFLAQLIRAAKKGYLALPLLYSLDREDIDQSLYTGEQIKGFQETLAKLAPSKTIFVHAPGKDEAFGSVARSKQFHQSLAGQSSFLLSAESDADARTRTLSSFANSTTGVLNLTGMGGEGLDIPDVNTVFLASPSTSPGRIMQWIGRGVRLKESGPYARIVDETGENLNLIMMDLELALRGKSSEGKRQALEKLLTRYEAEGQTPEITKEVYEVLGVDPRLLGASPKVFSQLMEFVDARIVSNYTWKISATCPGCPLPHENEGLDAYFRRNRDFFERHIGLKPAGQVRNKLQSLIEFDGLPSKKHWDTIAGAWNQAFAAAWENQKENYTWKISDKCPECPLRNENEGLSTYFRRNRDFFEKHVGLKPAGQVRNKLQPLIEFDGLPSEKQWNTIKNAWHNAFKSNPKGLKPSPPESWPKSEILQKELPRLEMLYLAVASEHLKYLQGDPEAGVWYVGRDADDFKSVLEALIQSQIEDAAQRESLLKRVRRFALSRNMLMGNPKNPAEFSRLSTTEIAEVLRVQGVNVQELAGSSSAKWRIFDTNFDGHVIRPLLGTLLKETGLSIEAFAQKVQPEFLLSKPSEGPVIYRRPEEDALQHRARQVEQKEKSRIQNWQAFVAAMQEKPDSAFLKYLRSYGELQIPEFPLVEAFETLIQSGLYTKEEILALWEREGSRLLTSPEEFRFWIEKFVEGKGMPDDAVLRTDLARSEGRLKKVANAQLEFEGPHPTEAHIHPESQKLRHEYLCHRLIQKLTNSTPQENAD